MACGYVETGTGRTCQFVREMRTVEVNGRPYCRFHQPLEPGDVKANWSGSELVRFADDLEHLVRSETQDVDLTGIQLPALPDSRTYNLTPRSGVRSFTLRNGLVCTPFILELTIEGDLDIRGTVFRQKVDIGGRIGGTFHADAIHCSGPVAFRPTVIGSLNLRRSTLRDDFVFQGRMGHSQAQVNHDWTNLQLNGRCLLGGHANGRLLDLGNFRSGTDHLPVEFLITLNVETFCLSGAEFQGPMTWQGQSPDGCKNVDFSSARWHGSLTFRGVIHPDINLTLGVVDGTFSLQNVSALGEWRLDEFQCGGTASLQAADFTKALLAVKSCWRRSLIIDHDSTCNAEVDFGFSQFSDLVLIQGKFLAPTNFAESTFHGSFLLGRRRDVLVIDRLDFSKATFHSDFECREVNFRGYLDFSGCVFYRAPRFPHCTLRPDTDFPQIDGFLDTSVAAESAYRTLRHETEQSRYRSQEGVFFTLEQRCRRQRGDISGLERTFSALYDWVSQYGQSLGRPVVWLVGLTALFAGLYAYFDNPYQGRMALADGPALTRALDFSFQQVFQPFRIWAAAEPGPGLAVKLIASVQSLCSFGLLACFAIAVRWRFRRG